jgi:hemoglobin-like flavoprotein
VTFPQPFISVMRVARASTSDFRQVNMDSIIIRHLRESVALLPMENSGPANEFYRRLFELAPEVRPMFTREIGLQAKKFSDMLAWVITNLDRPDELLREMRALGARHSGYGVTIDQYAPVGSALIWMFQHTLGDRFTAEMEEAWLEFYAFLSFEMERGSREAAPTGACQ